MSDPLAVTVYPAALHGSLDEDLSRWRWLAKWFLAIPHLIARGPDEPPPAAAPAVTTPPAPTGVTPQPMG